MSPNGSQLSDTAKHVVILGGGFGGLYAALEFEKLLKRERDLRVTLISDQNFFLFTPMLHEVAASDLDLTTIVNPIRKMIKRVDFFKGNIKAVDLVGQQVTVTHADGQHLHEFKYDHLILAMGAVTNFFNLPGLEERALGMKSLGDAVILRNKIIDTLEEADFECASDDRQPLLTVVVAGGGFSGVETMGAINDFMRSAIRSYTHLKEENIRMVLVHPGPYLLPELGEPLGRYAAKKLQARKVEILLNTRVAGCTETTVTLSDGSSIASRTLIWTAGTTPSPLIADLNCTKDHERVVVDEFLEVKGTPGVWALGDCAYIMDPHSNKPYPPTAQHALRQGPLVAKNILATLKSTPKKPFTYSTLGQMAAIGHRTGVAIIVGVSFSGYFAWLLWRAVYLMKLPRFEKKLRVVMEWTLDIFFAKDLVQFVTHPSPALSRGQMTDPVKPKAPVAP